MNNQPVGLLLAAGKSQRFGSNKLLYPVFDNTPMLLTSAQTMAKILPGSIVVISKEMDSYCKQLEQLGLRVVINEKAEQGLGSSIACGVSHSKDASGWLIALADMPYIKQETYSMLLNKLKQGAAIVAPEYENQRGHPVCFSHVYQEELSSLNQEFGARNIINKNKKQLELLIVNDEGVLRDIDYPGDAL